ncbi:MAG: bifunctional precorrin-2 dehydrogenase/sirohydrochlorin ferrochelatase [Lawsonibacter sp.]|nr:bifunctional precorrin-2 dehydrogenase/sirohydrochlorin ferrochelatase [Lawsonibacter sp.]
MGCFPFFIELAGRPGLIAGGGEVALRKVERLLPYGPRLTMVAPRFHPALEALPNLARAQRPFQTEDLEGMDFVVAATDDPQINRQIAGLCRSRRILVNAVDDREACTFLFPALVQRGSLSVGISTGGASPTAAQWLKEQVESLLPQKLDSILAWLEEQRPALKTHCSDSARRGALYARLFFLCLEVGGPPPGFSLAAFLKEEQI